uniref:Protein kinase domain-containing protein n=1 Tax=viral metagenome TaxID=1070528 RepID=A0A6C0ERS6_9ZZZZ
MSKYTETIMTDLGNPVKLFQINFCKRKEIDLEELVKQYIPNKIDLDNEYKPFSMSKFQNYNPIYNHYFDMDETTYNRISLNSKYQFKNLYEVENLDTNTCHEKSVFIKYSPLIDPIRYMIGKYQNIDKDYVLPSIDNDSVCFSKLKDPNNMAYTDCFFSYLSSQLLNHHGFVHGIDFFGSFLGIQEKFKANVTDDLEYLNNSNFFNQNVGILFSVTDTENDNEMDFGSRNNRKKIAISSLSNPHNLSAISLGADIIEINNDIEGETELVYKNNSKKNSSYSSSSSSDKSVVNYTSDDEDDNDDDDNYSTCSSDESDSTSSDEEQDPEEEIYAYISNFPVQMICLEKCDGTIDSLFEKDVLDKQQCASAMFQIIITLATYQKAFKFTHNDLHTNNIMYINTDIEYLYYCYNKKYYKVPTYGRIYKIIDFGRSIYKYQGKTLCSDSFAPGGDAVTQYNCEPFMNENKPRLEPNMSFDLCRLGCSIYDFVIDHENNHKKMDDFQKTILRWCMDDNDKNVLYKANGDERYPNFKLYKMIARTVHKHTPEEQFKFPLLSQFEIAESDVENQTVINIDKIPSYT